MIKIAPSILSADFVNLARDIQRVSIVGGIVCGVQCAVLVASIFPVERVLRREFDEFGRRKG